MEVEDRLYQDALGILDRLRSRGKENEDEIRLCVKGDALREYLIANDMAVGKLRGLKERLLRLQTDEAQLGL